MSELVPFLGRFHPLLVHFPIALLVAGAAAAGWCAWRARRGLRAPLRAAVEPLLWLGALGAVLAAGTGLLLGAGEGYGGAAYEGHRAAGLAVAVSAVLAAAVVRLAARRPSRSTRVASGVLLAHTLVALTTAGHLGATLTHGEAYLTQRAPEPARALLARLGLAPPAAARTAADQAFPYDALVEPVLRARCAGCHGDGVAQGGLRLDSADGLRAGGQHGPVLAPGRPVASELLRRVALPATDSRAMPPGGRRPVTAGEGALLRWWIEAGAPFDRRLAELELPPEVRAIVEAQLGPLAAGGPTLPRVDVPEPDPRALGALAAGGVSVRPIAAGLHFVDVRAGRAGAAFGDAGLSGLQPIAPQVAWLSLAGTGVTDAGLATVATLPNVVRLDLARTAVTDAGLAQLARLAQLESLNLYGTRVGDAGLQRLAGVKTLRSLFVWQTAVTPAGVERLRSALPRLRVDTGAAPAGE